MPNAPHFNDRKHWRRRAEEARVLAEQVSDETIKKMMLRIADDYDDLAVREAIRVMSPLPVKRVIDETKGS